MNIKQLFRSFRQKLIWENLIKTLLFSLMASGVAVFCTSLVYHVLLKPTPKGITMGIGIFVFLLSAVLYFILRYPNPKRVAGRLDELGLQERVGTMLELKDEKTPIAELQRKDAISHLKQIKPSQLTFRIGKKEWVSCVVSLCLAFVMILLPYNFLSFGASADSAENKSALKVKEFIDQLRAEVKESAVLDQEMKDALEKIVEELEEALEETDDPLEQAAKIEEAKEKVDEEMEKVISKDAIGEALKKNELTYDLGDALVEASEKKVKSSLGDLQKKVKEDPAVAKDLSRAVATALSESGVAADDELYLVLEQFSLVLKEVVPDSDTFEEALQQSFEDAERNILEILKKQKEAEKEKEKIKEAMDKAKKDALKKEKEEGEESETKTGEGEESETETGEEKQTQENKPSQNKPTQNRPTGGKGEDGGENPSGEEEMKEEIFDPVSGSVSYGKVFALYYAEYLAALEKGEVSEELQAIMDRYYSSLN